MIRDSRFEAAPDYFSDGDGDGDGDAVVYHHNVASYPRRSSVFANFAASDHQHRTVCSGVSAPICSKVDDPGGDSIEPASKKRS